MVIASMEHTLSKQAHEVHRSREEHAKLQETVMNQYEYNQSLNNLVNQLKRHALEMEDREAVT
jgi:vacuolar-type H+-ATPase subunit B/Vma2